jgi:DNA repair protein RAD50
LFTKISESLDDVEKRFQQADLQDVTRQLDEANRSIQAKEEEVKGLGGVIKVSTADLASQEHTRRNMLANLSLRANVTELDGLRAQLHELVQHYGGEDFASKLRDAERDMQRTQRSQQNLSNSRDMLKGKLEVYSNQVSDLKAKLNAPLYKGIEEKHRRKNIEYETTNLAISDLESYYNAL